MMVNRPLRRITLFLGIFLLALTFVGWGAGICGPGKATLKVITDPEEAKVTVDTGEEGITPCTLEVPSGKRSLTIKTRGYIASHVEVQVSAEEPTEVKIKLKPIPTT
jgi:hypothetical protein